MTPLLLSDIERAVRSSWSAETCTPEFRSRWTEDNPARDQCGVTAMVLNDLLGGELIRGEVHVSGERVDYHWWNRLSMGIEVDLTREQFGPEETVIGAVVIPRPPVTEWRRLREEYELLRDRVLEKLNRQQASASVVVPRQPCVERVDEMVERVDEQDQVLAVVGRGEAVRRGWLHRIAVTVCRDREGRILVHRRSEHVDRFPGHYEVGLGGAVAPGEFYEEAASRELAEELGVRAPVRFIVKFLNRSGLSPHWLAVHEAVLSDNLCPDPDEVMWHGWLSESELLRSMRENLFTPDTHDVLSHYFSVVERRIV